MSKFGKQKKQLLVINYAMDEDDPLLSHQVEAVGVLAFYFDHVWVLTSRAGNYAVPPNVTVIDSQWVKGRIVSNIYRIYRHTLPLLLRNNLVVFSHMTDVQCALISPLTKILRIRHVLWYAHKTNSLYLKWSSLWVSGIVTSTKGSCPINRMNVSAIGQAIDLANFRRKTREIRTFNKWIHIGRFDPSKNLEEIIRVFRKLENSYLGLTFEQVGDPSTEIASLYAENILKLNEPFVNQKKITFSKSIPRREVANKLINFDVFVHCYQGSLDKSILEATVCGIPVITINPEYLKEFGSWSGLINPSLEEEFRALSGLNSEFVEQELHRRIEYIRANHSLNSWGNRIAQILQIA